MAYIVLPRRLEAYRPPKFYSIVVTSFIQIFWTHFRLWYNKGAVSNGQFDISGGGADTLFTADQLHGHLQYYNYLLS